MKVETDECSRIKPVDIDPDQIAYIRAGCRVLPFRRKRCEQSRYIITGETLTGVFIERVWPAGSIYKRRFISFAQLYKYYRDIPAEVMFSLNGLKQTFMPIVYMNEDLDGL